jgi:hypothetical protein
MEMRKWRRSRSSATQIVFLESPEEEAGAAFGRERTCHGAIWQCILQNMAGGTNRSLFSWRRNGVAACGVFNESVEIEIGVNRSKAWMKQRHRNFPLFLLIGFCVIAFEFSIDGLRAEEASVPSPTTVAKGAVASPTPPGPSPYVGSVGLHTYKEVRNRPSVHVERGDDIWVDIYNFERWCDELEKEKKLPEQHDIKNLILYLDHRPLSGVAPVYWYETSAWTSASKDEPSVEYKITTVYFPLVRNDASKSTWSHLLNQPVLERRLVVSVGFNNGEEIRTELRPDAQGDQKLDQQFFLTIIPKFRTALGFIVILIALIAFFTLARYTHIIRDANAPCRPDGQPPYSLARGQMAFWFFLVIASYFFLWVVTGAMDTLNTSVLALIGISAGTALSSAFVDAAKPVPAGSSGNQPIVDVTRPHAEVLAELKQLRDDTQKELEGLQKARASISPSDTQALEDNEQKQNEVRERLVNYRWQSAYFSWPTWKGVMYDLLAENNLISFHRFQIFVWTLVLGIMFVSNVYNELAMPAFSATLLGLLGISAGTYIGFKLPETKTQ